MQRSEIISKFKTKVSYTEKEIKRILQIHEFFRKKKKDVPIEVLQAMYDNPEDNGVVEK